MKKLTILLILVLIQILSSAQNVIRHETPKSETPSYYLLTNSDESYLTPRAFFRVADDGNRMEMVVKINFGRKDVTFLEASVYFTDGTAIDSRVTSRILSAIGQGTGIFSFDKKSIQYFRTQEIKRIFISGHFGGSLSHNNGFGVSMYPRSGEEIRSGIAQIFPNILNMRPKAVVKNKLYASASQGIVRGRVWIESPEMNNENSSHIEYSFYSSPGRALLKYQLTANSIIEDLISMRKMKYNGQLNVAYFENQLKIFDEEYTGDENGCAEAIWEESIVIDEKFTSFIVLHEACFVYTCGAHGQSSEKNILIRRTDGKVLKLDDVISDKAKFYTIAEKYFRLDNEVPSGMSLNEAGFDFPNGFTCFDNFYIEDGEIKFVYMEYQIAPYSMGTIRFGVPIDQIKHLLTLDLKKRF